MFTLVIECKAQWTNRRQNDEPDIKGNQSNRPKRTAIANFLETVYSAFRIIGGTNSVPKPTLEYDLGFLNVWFIIVCDLFF